MYTKLKQNFKLFIILQFTKKTVLVLIVLNYFQINKNQIIKY